MGYHAVVDYNSFKMHCQVILTHEKKKKNEEEEKEGGKRGGNDINSSVSTSRF